VTGWRRLWGLTYGEACWLGLVSALLAYELVVILFKPEGLDVLTRAYRANVQRWTVWPVALGILCGHLNGPVLDAPRWSVVAFILMVTAALARDVLVRTPIPGIATFGIFMVSVVVGASCWGGRP